MMKPQAEAMAAAMRAQYGKPKPAGPVADPGAASMAGTMSKTPAGRTAIAGWMREADPRVSAQLFYDDMTTDLRRGLGGSGERRGGKEGVSTCRCRWSPYR